MRFRDFVFRDVPHTLETVYRRRITETALAGKSMAVDGGSVCREIVGSGEFMGEDAAAQFEALQRAMGTGGPGLLCLPGQRPFLALAEKLELTGKHHPNALGYAFRFVEAAPKVEEMLPDYVTAAENETLWDIAWHFGRNIDDMVRANPHVPKIRRLRVGEKIYVAKAGEG